MLSAPPLGLGLHLGPACADDVEAVAGLLRSAGVHCLPVGREELVERLGEFEVARSPSGRAVGCVAVRRTDDRTELRCLAVHPSWRGAGVGRRLVELAVERALSAGEDLFCVSRKPAFFESIGFARLPAAAVPSRPEASAEGPPRYALLRQRQPFVSLSEAVA